MSLNRSEKEALVARVAELAANAKTMVLAEYRGLTVADMDTLRADARSRDVTLNVLKNTLARRAVTGSNFEVLAEQMTGPLLYGFSEDAVSAAKVLADFAKTNSKLVIRSGVYGDQALDEAGVKELASIPTKDVLLAQLCGLLMSPVSRTALVLSALAASREAGSDAGGGEAEADAAAETA